MENLVRVRATNSNNVVLSLMEIAITVAYGAWLLLENLTDSLLTDSLHVNHV